MSFEYQPKNDGQEHYMERSWDPQVTQPGPPPLGWKGNILPDPNLKALVVNKRLPAVHSAKTLPTRTTIDSTCSTTPSAFNSIAATFGFSHHVGTDKALELDVLKAILKRESSLATLQDTCKPKYSNNKIFLQNDAGTGVLDQLTSIRNITVLLIESVITWRQSMINADPEIPRPFMYESQNYLLKIIFDMDFLADISVLVDALGLDGEKLRCNPLMMPESLDRARLGQVPAELAREDANGETNSKLYQERLKLRTVEQTLLREMDFNRKGAPSVAWGEDEKTFTDGGDTSFRESTLLTCSINTDNTKARQADILAWYRQAQLQLIKLEEGIGEKLSVDFNSTYRLKIPVPEEEPIIRMATPSRMMPPTSLHEHNSTVTEVPLPDVRSRTPSPTRVSISGGGPFRKLRGLPSNSHPEKEKDVSTISTLAPALEWTREDIQLLLELEQAPRCVALACASTLILLASGPQIPKNISWETFCLHAKEVPVEEDMNAIVPSRIPQFKIRAISPFLGSLTETFEEDLASEDPETLLEAGQPRTEAIRKLVTWIMEVLNVATTCAKAAAATAAADRDGDGRRGGVGGPGVRASTSHSTMDSIKTRRLEANSGLKRKQALQKCKCPADMKVKHAETVEDELLAGATITVSLEIQKKKPTATSPKRFVIKVFDESSFQYAEVPVNCKEYSRYLVDLRDAFPNEEVELYFEPNSAKWWAKYLKEVSLVSLTQGGGLSVRVSKKAIRSLVSNQIKSKDAVDDGDLISQDDEMASHQPLKKEKSPEVGGGTKKKPSGTTKKEAAAAAASKAKELEAKRAEQKKLKQAKDEERRKVDEKKEERKLKEAAEMKAAEEAAKVKAEKESAEEAAKVKAAEEASKVKAAEEAAEMKAAEEAAAKVKTEKESAEESAKVKAAEEAISDEKLDGEAISSNKSESDKKEMGATEEEDNDGYEDEYDAEYDDENFVMTPKGSPNKLTNEKDEENKAAEPAKNEVNNTEEDDFELYGDDYDDDNYEDESTAKTLEKPEGSVESVAKDTSKPSDNIPDKDDDYDDDYDAEFDFDEEEE